MTKIIKSVFLNLISDFAADCRSIEINIRYCNWPENVVYSSKTFLVKGFYFSHLSFYISPIFLFIQGYCLNILLFFVFNLVKN